MRIKGQVHFSAEVFAEKGIPEPDSDPHVYRAPTQR